MEMQIAQAGEWTPAAAAGVSGVETGVASDILSGRDAEVGWEDVFKGREMGNVPDFHTEMEGRMRMNW